MEIANGDVALAKAIITASLVVTMRDDANLVQSNTNMPDALARYNLSVNNNILTLATS